MKNGDTHKRWTSWYLRRVTFVLEAHDHKLVLVRTRMKLRVRTAEHDRNIYEGPVLETWRTLTHEQRLLGLVGVLYADSQRDFAGTIDWVEESGNGKA